MSLKRTDVDDYDSSPLAKAHQKRQHRTTGHIQHSSSDIKLQKLIHEKGDKPLHVHHSHHDQAYPGLNPSSYNPSAACQPQHSAAVPVDIPMQMPNGSEDSGHAVQVTYKAVRDTASPSVSPHPPPFHRQGSPMPLGRDRAAFISDLNPGLSEPVSSSNVDTTSVLSSPPSTTHLLSSPSAASMTFDPDRTVGSGFVAQQKSGLCEQTPSSSPVATTMSSTPAKSFAPLSDHAPHPASSLPMASLDKPLPSTPTPSTPSLGRRTSMPNSMTDNVVSNSQTEGTALPDQSPCRCPLCVRGIAKDRAIERERKAREAAAAANLEQHRQAAIALENMQRDQQDAALQRERQKQQQTMEHHAQREEDRRRELWLAAENERRTQQPEQENAKQFADQFLTQREAQCQAEIWQHFQTNRDSGYNQGDTTPRPGTPNTPTSKAASIHQALLGREDGVRIGHEAVAFQNSATEVDWDRHINVHREDAQRHSQLRGEYVGVHGGGSDDESGTDDAVDQDCDHYVATLSYHGEGDHHPYKPTDISNDVGGVGARRDDIKIPSGDGRTRDRNSPPRSDGTPPRTSSWDLVGYPESTLSSVDGNDTTGDTNRGQPPKNEDGQDWKRASAPPGSILLRRRLWRPSPTAAVTALRKRGFWRNSETPTNADEYGTEREVEGAMTAGRVRSHSIASTNVEVDRTQGNRNKHRSTPVLPSTAELGRSYQKPGRVAQVFTTRAHVVQGQPFQTQ